MEKWNLKNKSKLLKIFYIFVYIEIMTFFITIYMEKLEKSFNIDFRLNNVESKFNSPLILLSNPKILIIFLFITFVIYLVRFNYKKSVKNAKIEIEGIKYREKDGTYGTASFANPHEMKDILSIGNPNENGLMLGITIDTNQPIILPDSYKGLNRNIIIIGASGSGKSRKFIIPNIMKIAEQDDKTMALEEAVKYGKNIVATDPKR